MNSKANVIYMPVVDPDYPLGKQLWLASCAARKIPYDRAELDWKNWEEGEGYFMTKGEWELTAKLMLAAHGDLQS